MRRWILLLCALTTACGGQAPPSAYQHSRDAFFAVLPMQFIDEDFYPCFRTLKGKQIRLADAECYRFAGPQRMHGVIDLFFGGGGGFHINTSQPPGPQDHSQYWVNLPSASLPDQIAERCNHCYLYVDFIGRKSLVSGRFGHMGMSNHIVVIDRVLATRIVGQRSQ